MRRFEDDLRTAGRPGGRRGEELTPHWVPMNIAPRLFQPSAAEGPDPHLPRTATVSCTTMRRRSRRPAEVTPRRRHGARRRRQPTGIPDPPAPARWSSSGTGGRRGKACAYLGETTNNVAEYRALLLALEEAARHAVSSLTVHIRLGTPRPAVEGEVQRWKRAPPAAPRGGVPPVARFPGGPYTARYRARRTGGRIPWRTSRSISTGKDKSSEEARWPPVPAPHRRGREESPGSAGQGAG